MIRLEKPLCRDVNLFFSLNSTTSPDPELQLMIGQEFYLAGWNKPGFALILHTSDNAEYNIGIIASKFWSANLEQLDVKLKTGEILNFTELQM